MSTTKLASATPAASTDTTAPAAPTGLTATAGDGSVALDWADNTESDLADYNVYRSTTSGSGYSKLNSSLVTSSAYTDTTVTNGTTYYYVVTAVDTSSNESASSNEASATPAASSGTMHVGDLDGSSTNQGSSWTAMVTITIHNSSHNAVSGATVSGTFTYNGSSFSVSCLTESNGTCTVEGPGIPKRVGSVTFTVDSIRHATLTYDSSANHEPDGDSTGTSITVVKPA